MFTGRHKEKRRKRRKNKDRNLRDFVQEYKSRESKKKRERERQRKVAKLRQVVGAAKNFYRLV